MKKVVIHIGFGKTGTTLFQKHLFSKHPQINYLGGLRQKNLTSADPVKRNIYELFRAIVTHDSCEFDQNYWRSFYQEQIYPKLAEAKVNLISEEWLSLSPVSLVRGDRGLIAERIFEILGADVKILMFIRNQLNVLNSLFNNHLDLIIPLYSRDYSWWYRHQVDLLMFYKLLIQTADYGILSRYKYFPLAQKYSSLFRNNFKVKLYEDFNTDQEEFLKTLAGEMNIEVRPFLENLPQERVKRSAPKGGLTAEVKKLIATKSKPDVFQSADVFSGNYSGLKNMTRNEAENFVMSYFQEDNRKMSNLIKEDLAEYGYPI